MEMAKIAGSQITLTEHILITFIGYLLGYVQLNWLLTCILQNLTIMIESILI